MSKIAILADLHFGVKNDHYILLENAKSFFDNVFFPYCDKNNIKTVIDLGDLFDRRKYINFMTLRKVKEFFFNELQKRNMVIHSIVGNHNCYYKNTNEINSLKELLEMYNNVHIYESPTEIEIDSKKISLVPWINQENHDESIEFIQQAKNDILCGHFEISGYTMNGGMPCQSGLSQSLFEKYQIVLSGHFHKRHSGKHIHYVGTPYQMSFADVGETKGFHILDIETFELEFIKNPQKLFYKLYYDDKENLYDFDISDFSIYKNCYIKIVVLSKTNPSKFEELMNKIYDSSPADISIVEPIDSNIINKETNVDLTQDTLSIIKEEIDKSENIIDSDKIKDIMIKLYTEASLI